jgi:hypothetical protein
MGTQNKMLVFNFLLFFLFIEQREQELKRQDKITEQTSLMNVEEIMTDFNWKTSGNAAVLEKRLLGELHALEAVSGRWCWPPL